MPISDVILLIAASFTAGAVNSVAGGGSFLTFPALLFTGITPVVANATGSTALTPGGIMSALAYRENITGHGRLILALSVTSLVGATLGALLLVGTPQSLFAQALPFLMLAAALIFTFGERLMSYVSTRNGAPLWLICVLQLFIALYGGYFGGGQGFLMLALLTLARVGDIHRMNGIKSLLAVIHNGVGIIVFGVAGVVAWLQVGVMMAGSIPGAWLGAKLAQRVHPSRVRGGVVVLAWVITAWFMWRAFAAT